jgi:chemotaxis protein CheY-P-specific phosphatase CheC
MNRQSELLAQVVEDTLASMAFVFTTEPADAGSPGVTAQVAFSGPCEGELMLRLPKESLAEIAANMLGADEQSPPTTAQQSDALGEVLNVVAGNLLPLLAGREAVFNVSPPRVLGDVPLPQAGGEPGPLAVCTLWLQQGQATATLLVTRGGEVLKDATEIAST